MRSTEEPASILFYWQEAWLPHSRYLVEKVAEWSDVGDVAIAGPRNRRKVASVFTVLSRRKLDLKTAKAIYTKSYRWREAACTFREWRRMIKERQPAIIMLYDEALSLNVLLAGIANKLYGRGVVLFYGFENIIQGTGFNALRRNPNIMTFRAFVRKTVRYVLLDRMMMPLRRRIVHGGLISYDECRDVIRAFNWDPPMLQQWLPIDEKVFTANGPVADFHLNVSFTVGFVGRFVPEKGVIDLLHAISTLGDRYGAVFIGDGPELPRMQALIKECGMAERVRLIPAQNQEALAESYRAMDLLVLPSKSVDTWKEQFGRVLMEARYCGVRVAGSDSGAIPMVVGDSEMIFKAGDSAAIADVIRRASLKEKISPNRVGNATASEFMNSWVTLAKMCRTRT